MQNKECKIYLHGSLGETYGTEPMSVYTKTTKTAFQYLSSRLGVSFKQTILQGNWHIAKGSITSSSVSELDDCMPPEEVELPLQENELHVFPEIGGAGGKGGSIIQMVMGVILIIVGIVLIATGGGATLGAYLIITGVTMLASGLLGYFTKSPRIGKTQTDTLDPRPSFLYNGVVNNTEQGVPVPLVYGEMITGTTVIFARLKTLQI